MRPRVSRFISLFRARGLAFPSYGAAMVGVATAKTPCGPYTYKSSFKPLGADSRDESVFQDGASPLCCADSAALTGALSQMTVRVYSLLLLRCPRPRVALHAG